MSVQKGQDMHNVMYDEIRLKKELKTTQCKCERYIDMGLGDYNLPAKSIEDTLWTLTDQLVLPVKISAAPALVIRIPL